MDVVGIQKLTLIDYPGKVACTLFTPLCNFKCVYCHNPDLVLGNTKVLDEEELFKFLRNRYGFLGGVVITGGEPTVHKDLPDLISKIKEIGYLVKLDTNGTNPLMIKELISKNLIDFIAMDIKAPIKKYKEVVGVNINKEDVLESIRVILNSKIDYVFRTTVWPKLTIEDYEEMGKLVKGAKLYHLQQYSNKITLDPCASDVPPLPRAKLEEIAKSIKNYVSKVELINV